MLDKLEAGIHSAAPAQWQQIFDEHEATPGSTTTAAAIPPASMTGASRRGVEYWQAKLKVIVELIRAAGSQQQDFAAAAQQALRQVATLQQQVDEVNIHKLGGLMTMTFN